MADKRGGKAATPDDIMGSGDVRAILAQAKLGNAPSCAIAMTKAKDGVILLDKRAKPKKVLGELKKKAGGVGLELEATTLRFGRASVDPEGDASLLTLTVNKEAPSALRPRLLDVLKKAGFTKLEIVVDALLEAESEADDLPPANESGAAGLTEPPAPSETSASVDTPSQSDAAPQAPTLEPPAAPPPPPAPPPAPPLAPTPTPAPPPSLASPAPPSTEPVPDPPPSVAPEPVPAPDAVAVAPDLSALTARLTALVRGLAGVVAASPGQGATLMALAADANAALKVARQTGDTAQAIASVDAFEKAVSAAASGPGSRAAAGPTPSVNLANLEKASKAWLATRRKVESDIAKLRAKFASTFEGHQHVDSLTAGFDARVETVMTGLDEALAHRLADVTTTDDPAEHAKVVADAKTIIKRYEAFLASDPTIAEIDANPLVPLAIQKTLTATLEILNRAVV